MDGSIEELELSIECRMNMNMDDTKNQTEIAKLKMELRDAFEDVNCTNDQLYVNYLLTISG